MATPHSAPASTLPAPARPLVLRAGRGRWAALYLVIAATGLGWLAPITVGAQPQAGLTAGVAALGSALLLLGVGRRWNWLIVPGSLVLWGGIVAGLVTHIAPLAAPPSTIWAERGALLLAVLGGWVGLLWPPPWLRRGALAAGLPTALALVLLAGGAPPTARRAAIYWPAVDRRGTVYASDVDGGEVWLFDAGGTVQGRIWPRLAPPPGTPGPGIQPVGSEQVRFPGGGPAALTPVPGGPGVNEFLFCGLAVDPQDSLYLADLEYRRILRFGPDGQLRAVWPLPATYHAARGCLAATTGRVYVADEQAGIYSYTPDGRLLARWPLPLPSEGLSVLPDGRLAVLDRGGVTLRDPRTGDPSSGWALPPPGPAMAVPYQAILARRDGTLLVTDVAANRLLCYTAEGGPCPAPGGPGAWPGQFAGLGGLAEDRQGRLYITDFDTYVLQRFRPDGAVEGVWSIPLPFGDAEAD